MRTSLQLERIAKLALLLKEQRGDTEWTGDERTEVDTALNALESLLHNGADDGRPGWGCRYCTRPKCEWDERHYPELNDAPEGGS